MCPAGIAASLADTGAMDKMLGPSLVLQTPIKGHDLGSCAGSGSLVRVSVGLPRVPRRDEKA